LSASKEPFNRAAESKGPGHGSNLIKADTAFFHLLLSDLVRVKRAFSPCRESKSHGHGSNLIKADTAFFQLLLSDLVRVKRAF
jgi:hypothetical protein